MWTYKGKEVHSHEDLLPGCTDFVYEITYTNGQMYIGKKCVRSIRRLKPTKAQLKIRKNYVRKELKDLPFLKYCGSHDKVGLEVKSKKILYQCSTKKAATYLETALLFHLDAIFDPEYVNENIAGTHFDNSLDGYIQDTSDFVPVSEYTNDLIINGEIGAIR